MEHYFQAQKFEGEELLTYRKRIRKAQSPKEAKALGRSRKYPIRQDWDAVRDDVMWHALEHKFRDPRARQILVETGDRPLVEASPFDYYWGSGRDGSGLNRLGGLLMELRDRLKLTA